MKGTASSVAQVLKLDDDEALPSKTGIFWRANPSLTTHNYLDKKLTEAGRTLTKFLMNIRSLSFQTKLAGFCWQQCNTSPRQTNTALARTTCPNPMAPHVKTAGATRMLPVLLLLLSVSALKAAQYGDFTYSTNGNNATITGYTGAGGSVTIPGSIPVNGINLPVISIGEEAFAGCTSLTNVIIPNGVTSIGDWAFDDCTSLISVTIPNFIINFSGGTSLTSVTIPNSVTSIGGGAFADCTSLTGVTIPNGVTSIGDWAFDDCPGLTAVCFQGNAPSIGSYVFSGATVYYLPGTTGWGGNFGDAPTALWIQFTFITNNSAITITGNTVAAGAVNVPGIILNIPSTINGYPVTSIGDGAFLENMIRGPWNVTSATIGTNVTSIGGRRSPTAPT